MQLSSEVFTSFLYDKINVLEKQESEIKKFMNILYDDDFFNFFNFLNDENYKRFINDWYTETEDQKYKSIIKESILEVNSENNSVESNILKLKQNKKDISIKTLKVKYITLENVGEFKEQIENALVNKEKYACELKELEDMATKKNDERIDYEDKKKKSADIVAALHNPYVRIVKINEKLEDKLKLTNNIDIYFNMSLGSVSAALTNKEFKEMKELLLVAKKTTPNNKDIKDKILKVIEHQKIISSCQFELSYLSKDLARSDQKKLELRTLIEDCNELIEKYTEDIESLYKKHTDLEGKIKNEEKKVLEANVETLIERIKNKLSEVFFEQVYATNNSDLIQKIYYFAKENDFDTEGIFEFVQNNKRSFKLNKFYYLQRERNIALMNRLLEIIKEAKSWLVKEDNFKYMIDKNGYDISNVFLSVFEVIINQLSTVFAKTKQYNESIIEVKKYYKNQDVETQYVLAKLYELNKDNANKIIYSFLNIEEGQLETIEELNENEVDKLISKDYVIYDKISFMNKTFDTWISEIIAVKSK